MITVKEKRRKWHVKIVNELASSIEVHKSVLRLLRTLFATFSDLECIIIFSWGWNPMTGGTKETVVMIGGVELEDGVIMLALFLSLRLAAI